VEENSDCELLSTEYTKATDKMHFRCRCGKEFWTDWHHFTTQEKHVCNSCAEERRRQKKRKHSIEEIKDILSANGCEYISGEYKNTKSRILIRGSCGHIFESTFDTMRSVSFTGKCIDCARKMGRDFFRFSLDDVRKKSSEKGLELLSDTYSNARSPLRFRCSCGREFTATWDSVVSKGKTSCDHCSGLVSSGELAVEQWLIENEVPYVPQKTFPDLIGLNGKKYRFDFFLPEENLCIEYDGPQHTRKASFGKKLSEDEQLETLLDTMSRDGIKDQYCRDNGLELLRISYRNKNKIPEILSSKLIPRYAGELKSSRDRNA